MYIKALAQNRSKSPSNNYTDLLLKVKETAIDIPGSYGKLSYSTAKEMSDFTNMNI